MDLKFFGKGSGFADEHTSAYFCTDNNEIVIIDCPTSMFFKIKKSKLINLKDYTTIYILITHTHPDHVGALALFIQYAYFVLKIPVIIVSPSFEVEIDINTILKIQGVENYWYKHIVAASLNKPWLCRSILTNHAPLLKGKCFGYQLIIGGKNVIYTGDTSTLEPFLPYLIKGSILYVDTSVHYGIIHLKLENTLGKLISLTYNGIKVFLMHLDDAITAQKIISSIPNINIVEVIE